MRKSELYARYHNFRSDIIEISPEEFNQHIIQENKEHITSYEDGSTYVITIRLDGCDYISYASHWNVGWQGDIDGDNFYCKKRTLSQAELEDLSKIFC